MIERLALPLVALSLCGCPPGLEQPVPTAMITLAGGSFTMGWARDCQQEQTAICDPSSYAQRNVKLSPYLIDRHEVTNAQYRFCVARGVCTEPVSSGLPQIPDYYTSSAYDDYPVIYVSWVMAVEYCRFRELRLPTEAEWEYAARARLDGTSDQNPRQYPWGNDAPTCDRARIRGCGNGAPDRTEAAPGDVSDLGVRDLGGNVAEWVQDFFDSYTYCRDGKSLKQQCGDNAGCIQSSCFDSGGAARPDCVLLCSDLPAKNTPYCMRETAFVPDPRGPAEGSDRVIRGGSVGDGPCAASSTFRQHAPPAAARATLGFRCARSGS